MALNQNALGKAKNKNKKTKGQETKDGGKFIITVIDYKGALSLKVIELVINCSFDISFN